MNWPRGAGGEHAGNRSRVYGAEGGVDGVRREHVEPPVLDELARIRHVPGAELVQQHEVGDVSALVGHPLPQEVAHSVNEN